MADEPNKTPSEVQFFFEYDKDYRIVATNGVWGGITPRADIQLDFFVERLGVPESIVNKVTEEGRLGGEISREPPKRVVRRLQVGVLMSLEDAELLEKFLTERIKDVKKIKETMR